MSKIDKTMKNTNIYMWLKPVFMNHQQCNKKIYINLIIEGDHTHLDNNEVDTLISGDIFRKVMDDMDIDMNENYEVLNVTSSDVDVKGDIVIERLKSPKQIKKEKKALVKEEKMLAETKRVTALVQSSEPLKLEKSDITINDGGIVNIKSKELNLTEDFDFAKLWGKLEEKVLPNIKEGDEVELKDDHGNIIFTLRGGSYLNAAIGQLRVYGHDKQIKGSLFVRDDGSFCIGDIQRNFYLRINTANLLKASVLNGVGLNGFLGEQLKLDVVK